MLDIFTFIDADLNAITEDELKRDIRRTEPPKPDEKILGAVHNREAVRLHVLCSRYQAMEDKANHLALFESTSEFEEAEAKQSAARYCSLHRICNEIFWHQCRDDIGIHTEASLGLRYKDGEYLVAVTKSQPNPLARLFGAIPLPGLDLE